MAWAPAYTVHHRVSILGGILWIMVLLYEAKYGMLDSW
jgi:hypothetical protein